MSMPLVSLPLPRAAKAGSPRAAGADLPRTARVGAKAKAAPASAAAALFMALGLVLIVALAGRASDGASSALATTLDTLLGRAPAALAPVEASTFDPRDGRSRVVRWRSAMADFAAADAAHPPLPGGVVVVGSSSVRYWNIEAQFPGTRIVKRGFGGSRLADTAYYADRIVLPYKPRQVIVYAGDNDLADGLAPEDVAASFASLVRQVHAELPSARVAFMSVKPSPQRRSLQAAIARTNALVAAYARTVPNVEFIDVHSRMLDATGSPRADLFQPDGLHLNAAGYEVWKAAVAGHLG